MAKDSNKDENWWRNVEAVAKAEKMKEKELTLKEAEKIVDTMYQNKFVEAGVDEGNTIHLGNMDNVQFNDLENASIYLLRKEISLREELQRKDNNWNELKKYLTIRKRTLAKETSDLDRYARLELNIITDKIKELEAEIQELQDAIVWWNNRYNALQRDYEDYKTRCEKAIEYIKKATRWFDSEYAKVYGELCSCAGANANRLEVLVNPSNLLNVLNGSDE